MVEQNELTLLQAKVQELEGKVHKMKRSLSFTGFLAGTALAYSVGSALFGFGKDRVGRYDMVAVGEEPAVAVLGNDHLRLGQGEKTASMGAGDGATLRLDDKTSVISLTAADAQPAIRLGAGRVTYTLIVLDGQLVVHGGDEDSGHKSSRVLLDYRKDYPDDPQGK